MKKLEGHVAIVTGGARGIGQELCCALAENGARVLCFDLSDAAETLERVRSLGGEGMAFQGSVTDASAVTDAVAQATSAWGRLDILVNCAARNGRPRTPFEEISEADWDIEMAINVKGPWLFCKAALPVMKAQGRGRIINFSSMTVWMGMPYLLHYSASKGAVLTLTRSLSRELAGTGITVNSITPGWHTTPAALEVAGDDYEQTKQRMLERQSVKRTGTPADLNGAVVFLASDDAEFITGQALNVDGGMYLH
jgi:3-oxoacyl-[acyl-carrier protein] reductase